MPTGMKQQNQTTAKALYRRLLETPGLCSGLTQTDDNTLCWSLWDGFRMFVGIFPQDCSIVIEQLLWGRYPVRFTHWHLEQEELYQQLCDLGRRGNVLVLRQSWLGVATLYCGSAAECPYPLDRRWHWGRMYALRTE